MRERPTSLQRREEREGSYREYKKRSPQDTANVPFYVYGDKLAILMLTEAMLSNCGDFIKVGGAGVQGNIQRFVADGRSF